MILALCRLGEAGFGKACLTFDVPPVDLGDHELDVGIGGGVVFGFIQQQPHDALTLIRRMPRHRLQGPVTGQQILGRVILDVVLVGGILKRAEQGAPDHLSCRAENAEDWIIGGKMRRNAAVRPWLEEYPLFLGQGGPYGFDQQVD